MSALIDAVAGGDARLLVVEGPAGIGKTSLAAVARRRAASVGLRVLAARASELEQDYPFGVARQWFEPVLAGAEPAQRARLLDGAAALAEAVASPSLTLADQVASPSILHGLFWLTANLAGSAPLLLMVDDAQWADQPSLRLLNYLAARIEGMAVGLVVACRPPDLYEDGALLARLLADPAIEVVRPATLTLEGTARLLGDRMGQHPEEPFVEACAKATGGNPFYLRELAQSLADEGGSPTADQVHRIAAVRPQSLSRAILTRISPPARELARALAIVEEPAELSFVAALAELGAGPASAAADELARAGLVEDPGRLALVHSIVRGAVLSSLSSAERSGWHARSATLLRNGGASPERIAAHVLGSDPSADPQVVATLREAAQLASARGAPEVAIRLLRRALVEPPDDLLLVEVLLDLGAAEREADLPEASERFREAHRRATDPLLRGEASRRLAWAIGSGLAGQRQLAPQLDREIAEVLPRDRELGLALEEARLTGLMLAPDGREELGARLERLGRLDGTTPGECSLLAMRARWLMDSGRSAAEVAEAAERAIGNPRALESKGPDSLWALNCSVALSQAEHFDALEAFLDRALELARERGSASGFALISTHRARVAHRRGALRRAQGEASAALDSGGLESWYRLAASGMLILALVGQGRLEEGQAAYEATGMGERMPDDRPVTPFLIVRGALRHAQGDLHRAVMDLRGARADRPLCRGHRGGARRPPPHRDDPAAARTARGGAGRGRGGAGDRTRVGLAGNAGHGDSRARARAGRGRGSR